MEQKQTYVAILGTTLKKKNQILDKLLAETKKQEELINKNNMDDPEFQKIVDTKEILLGNLNRVDDGFEMIYDRVKKELAVNRLAYKYEIIELQDLIQKIMEKSIAIQTVEQRNRSKMEIFFANKKKEIKNFHVQSRTAANYYRNMSNKHQDGQTYFVDKKN